MCFVCCILCLSAKLMANYANWKHNETSIFWESGALCCSGSSLTADLITTAFPFYLLCVLSSENYTEINSSDLKLGGLLLRLPGDHCLTFWNLRWRQQETGAQWKTGCYSTFLHTKGLQKISLLLGGDLPSVAAAKSGTLQFLCFFFSPLPPFFSQRHAARTGVRSHEGHGVKKKEVTFRWKPAEKNKS